MKSGRVLSPIARGFKRAILRVIVVVLGAWLLAIALFAFLPVPFSAVMIDRQISAWLRGDFSYVAHSDWVSMDEIAYVMPLAVIAA
ncbi:monofunctional biosynthetic peptidoglycan transglycosylase, partial [Lonsdalea quercina]